MDTLTPPSSAVSTASSRAASASSQIRFDRSIHLMPTLAPAPTVTLSSLNVEPSPLSPIAYTGPFPLLSPLGVRLHRQELLRPEVLENCMSQTWPSSVQLRGMAGTYSTFLQEVWNSEDIKDVVSKAAGVEVVPVMDYEVCHANIQINTQDQRTVLEQVRSFGVEPVAASANKRRDSDDDEMEIDRKALKEEDMVVEWHEDCYPFVVIVMLSDPKGMAGGETVIRKGDGSFGFVRAPEMGQALIFQGSRITHAALPTLNSSERITIVTSFRPKFSNTIPLSLSTDMSHLGNVRGYSLLSELYYQWTIYRFKVAKDSIANMMDDLEDKYEAAVEIRDEKMDMTTGDRDDRDEAEGKKGLCKKNIVDVTQILQFVQDLTGYLDRTAGELKAVQPSKNNH